MRVRLLAFGHKRAALGSPERELDCAPSDTPRMLVQRLDISVDTMAVRVAVNDEYSEWDAPIGEAREIALIPPVSGG